MSSPASGGRPQTPRARAVTPNSSKKSDHEVSSDMLTLREDLDNDADDENEDDEDDDDDSAESNISEARAYVGTTPKIRAEMKQYQSQAGLIIPRAPMLRLIKDMVEEHCAKSGIINHYRFTQEAIEALQTSAEAELVEKFGFAEVVRAHRGRATVTTDDMRLVPFLLRPATSQPPVFRAETKRLEKFVVDNNKKLKDMGVRVIYQKPTGNNDMVEEDDVAHDDDFNPRKRKG
jgi:histone H3/H4